MEIFSQGYLLDAKRVRWYQSQYVPNEMDLKSPEISPLFAPVMPEYPRTLVITAGFDPLRDEGLLHAQKLMDAGIETHHYHFDNMIHAFINFAKLVPDETDMLYQRIEHFLSYKSIA